MPRDKLFSHCAVSKCRTKYDGQISFFRFPKENRGRCVEWLELCGRMDLIDKDCNYLYNKLRVCGKHFKDDMFQNHLKNRLLPNAKPTYFLPNVTQDVAISNSPRIKQSSLEEKTEQVCSTFVISEPALQDSSIVLNEDHTYSTFDEPVASCSTSRSTPVSPLHIEISHSSEVKSSPLKSPVQTQTSQVFSNRTPRKNKLRQKIRDQREEIRKLRKNADQQQEVSIQQFKTLCEQFLPENFCNLAKAQVDLKNIPPKGRRYTEEYKEFALTLYFMSPKAYKFVQKSFILPSLRSLQRMTHSIRFNVGLNDFVFAALKLKTSNMTDKEKMCTLCLDEMSIKSALFYNLAIDEIIGFHNEGNGNKFLPAQSVMVLMARGIYNNFKQPLGFYFSNTTCKGEVLLKIVTDCISKLYREAGVKVKAIVSDQGSNFVELAKHLNVTVDEPYFFHNEDKIYYFFDAPHLLKSVRNNLLKYNICFNNGRASWKDILELYESDKNKTLRLVPRLTNTHVNPNGFEKMRVKYAVQILSESVAVGLSTYVSLGAMSPEAAGTALFVEYFDKLFDMFNSLRTKGVKKHNLSFMGADYQIKFLDEMMDFIKSIQIFDNSNRNIGNKIKCFHGWRMSINALKHLWLDLKSEGCSFLLTRRLNQDCLENFFGSIRSQGGNSTNPTPQNFINAFKKLFSLTYLQHSESGNCADDFDTILTKINAKVVKETFQEEVPNQEEILKFNFTDFRDLDLVTENALSYVCGYLFKKCLDIHDCEICRIASRDDILKFSNIFSHLKAYETKNKSTFGNLKMPVQNFIDFVRNMDHIFTENFENLSILPHISKQLLALFNEIPFEPPCANFPRLYVSKLFCRMKIFHSLKHANTEIKNTPKKNRKLINILSL